MIKGVNKNVIEISDTGNEAFERAILFVRPAAGSEDAERLRKRAREFLSGLKLRPRFYPKNRLLHTAARFCAAAVLGAAAMASILLLWPL